MALRKFTSREVYVLEQALKGQMDSTCKAIDQMVKEGKNPLFTTGFVKREHEDLIELVKSNQRKNKKYK